MKLTQFTTPAATATQNAPLVVGKTVPHPMDPEGSGDRRLVMVWRPTGVDYPKMEACWVYLDEL